MLFLSNPNRSARPTRLARALLPATVAALLAAPLAACGPAELPAFANPPPVDAGTLPDAGANDGGAASHDDDDASVSAR